eukprot:COSAG02_NODE_448_length_22102_cov_11.767032_2_plen_1431_part_00
MDGILGSDSIQAGSSPQLYRGHINAGGSSFAGSNGEAIAEQIVLRWSSTGAADVAFFHVHRENEFTNAPFLISVLPVESYTFSGSRGTVAGQSQQGASTIHEMEDDSAVHIELPFTFPFFGFNRSSVWILDNGLLAFGATASDQPSSKTQVGASFVAATVAPLWTDLRPDLDGAIISSTISAEALMVRWRAPAAVSKSICSGETVWDSPIGSVHSGPINEPYEASRDCSAILRAPTGYIVKFILTHLDSNSQTDFLYLHDGEDISHPTLAENSCCNPGQSSWCNHHYEHPWILGNANPNHGPAYRLSCGDVPPTYCGLSGRLDNYGDSHIIYSSGRDMLVRWRTDCHAAWHGGPLFGFAANWEMVRDRTEPSSTPLAQTLPREDVQATIRSNGSIEFDYFSLRVDSNATEVWTGVSNNFDDRPMEIPQSRLFEASPAVEGTAATTSFQIRSSVAGHYHETTFNVSTTRNHGTSAVSAAGVHTGLAAISVCQSDGSVFDVREGVVTSGAGPYENDLHCGVHLRGEGTFLIQLKDFATEQGYDFVTIFDGSNSGSPELAQLSGDLSDLPDTVESTGPNVYISFVTDVSVTAAGFTLEIDSIATHPWTPSDVAIHIPTHGSWLNVTYTPQNAHCFESSAKLLSTQCCADSTRSCSTARVVALNMRGLGLRGTIAPEIGMLRALTEVDISENFIAGELPTELKNLHQLRSLRLEHNQLQLPLDPAGTAELGSILNGFADLRTLQLSTSLEVADLSKTLITPVPPVQCAVGDACSFKIITRTASGDAISRGGQRIVVQLESSTFAHVSEASFECDDEKDGTYTCAVPGPWLTTKGLFEFTLAANAAPIVPMRAITNINTGAVTASESYPLLAISMAPIACSDVRARPNEHGSACVCAEGFVERQDEDGRLRCDSCGRGQQPTIDRVRCEQCAYGTYSAVGRACLPCPPGESPNSVTGAYLCSRCSEFATSPSGTNCKSCPAGQVANEARTQCVCPVGTYNATEFGGNRLQCVEQDLTHGTIAADSVCVPCDGLDCVASCTDEVRVRNGWAFTDPDSSPSHIFRCPIQPACVHADGHLCQPGHRGILCAVCERGFGKVGDECQLCSDAGRSHFIVVMVAAVVVLVLCPGLYIWRERRNENKAMAARAGQSIDNPLSGDLTSELTPGLRAAPTWRYRIGLWFRALYQPIRILVGYGQVVTQIGPVLHFDFPPGILQVFSMLSPLAVDLQSILQLDCILDASFYRIWVIRVFLIPVAMVAVVLLRYLYQSRRDDQEQSDSKANLKSDLFVVVFLIYPGICNRAFSMFNCRVLDSHLHVLVADYDISCDSAVHGVFQLVAGIVVVFFSLGVPVTTVVLMLSRIAEYEDNSESDRFVARRVADELKISDSVASDAIRDVSTGREYSFLVNAFNPRFFYWEGVDMVSLAAKFSTLHKLSPS